MPQREPTVILHVGAVPSASRLLQQCLQRNAVLWRSKRTSGLSSESMAGVLGRDENLVAGPAAFAAALRDAFADPDIDIVAGSRQLLGPAFGGPTGAGLHADANEVIVALAEATQDFRREIILSVCSPAELVEAHVETAMIRRGPTGVADPIASVDVENLSWLPVHRRLISAFGDDAVTVHDFRRTESGHVAFLREVFATAGLELPDAAVQRIPRPRLRLSDTGLRLANAARPHLSSKKERADLLTFLQRNFSELEGPPRTALSVDQRCALRNRYDSELVVLLAGAASDVVAP